MSNVKLYNGDCLEVMNKLIADGVKVDAIITDPPYNMTSCEWDKLIPFDEMWKRLDKLSKDTTPTILFGSEPFTSQLICSNLNNYKYSWYMQKERATNFLNCKKQPLRCIEQINVFYKKQCTYNPQIKDKEKSKIRPEPKSKPNALLYRDVEGRKGRTIPIDKTYPIDILTITRVNHAVHPTQKPIDLMEYLVKTYTNENDTVLDFTMGSGSTGVACMNINRNFIGIELDENYFKIAEERINKVKNNIFDL